MDWIPYDLCEIWEDIERAHQERELPQTTTDCIDSENLESWSIKINQHVSAIQNDTGHIPVTTKLWSTIQAELTFPIFEQLHIVKSDQLPVHICTIMEALAHL